MTCFGQFMHWFSSAPSIIANLLDVLMKCNVYHVHVSGIGDVKPIFGVPLATAVERSKSHDGVPLPIVVRETIDYIEEFGRYIVSVHSYSLKQQVLITVVGITIYTDYFSIPM